MERIPDANRTSIRHGFLPPPLAPDRPNEAKSAIPEPSPRESPARSVPPAPESLRADVPRADASRVRPRDPFEFQAPPTILASLAERIPYTHVGDDRILFAAEQLSRVPPKERSDLRTFVDALIAYMGKVGASDIDFGGPAAGGWVWYRIHGEKRPEKRIGSFTEDESNILILSVLAESSRRTLMDERALDFSHELPQPLPDARKPRFRASAYFDLEHLALNLRAIPDTIRSIQSLDFHPAIEQGLMFRHVRDGLTIITGVTGSGKSTTLDAIVDANNRDVEGHIVIIGKPIEYMHASQKCLVRHREVGRDVPSFKDGIVQSLRQDPDMVVIGEMRDPATISSALEITDSGHKVFSTLHTSSAVESLDRIIAEYPSTEQNRVRFRLADVLRCIVSQKLLPQVGGGRVLSKEVLWMTPSAKAAMKNGNTSEIYQMMWEGWGQGLITLEQDLFRLLKMGKITTETAMNFANNKRRLSQLLK